MENDLKAFNKVRGYRSMLGMTTAEMASYLGLARQNYEAKENGVRDFSKSEMANFTKLVKEFVDDITVDKIFF